MAVIKSSDLDFNDIKTRLKDYLKNKPEFNDYDFEASGVSNILDVLAYNTHLNGLIANFAINESFLSSAQLRSSVVSHAEVLGYTPRSVTSSRTVVNLSLDNVALGDRSPSITIPSYSRFTTNVNENSYTFYTTEPYIAVNNNGVYDFIGPSGDNNITLVEGSLKTKTFYVGEVTDSQIYVIPDATCDTSTFEVFVYDTSSSTSYTEFYNVDTVPRVTVNSTVYRVNEVPNGYYELTFSDGNALGRAPAPGNKIVIRYLSSVGAEANGATSFEPVAAITLNGTSYDLTVTTVSESAGGAEKESIDSIKLNAPIAFASQQRLVTAEDYEALILSKYSSYIDDVIAWGGNDNVPPVYGRVYVSLKFFDGTAAAVQETVKSSILNDLSANLAIMSIDTVFTDPELVYLELETLFNFDPNQSSVSNKSIENTVQNTINSFVATNLNKFNLTFRKSRLLNAVDNISEAILNSATSVKMQKRIIPTVNQSLDYDVVFPMPIAAPDDENNRIFTSKFTFNNNICTITNRLGTNILQIINLDEVVQLDNVGTYSADTGIVNIRGFNPQSFEGTYLRVAVIPANENTIKPLRNFIIGIDSGISFSRAVIDNQQTNLTI